MNEISKEDCKTIALKIRDNIFQPVVSYNTTVFLCGADINKKTTTRFKIAEIFTNRYWYSSFDLVYPEDIFDELLYSSDSADLLSLENLLADSVDAVVIIPESPGSFAELGAFANNEKLRNKIICVLDEKFKKQKSFINQGPLKLVKSVNKDGIIYINASELGKTYSSSIFTKYSRDKEADKIQSAIRKLKKTSSKTGKRITLLQLDKFLLPVIYLLEPVNKGTLISIAGCAMEEENHSSSSTTTALGILTKKRFIELTSNGYVLTELGTNEFLSFKNVSRRLKEQDKTIEIDNLRLEILNLKNRKKRLKV